MAVKRVRRETKEDVAKLTEISLLLNGYDDAFSDFDPRPYNERALSDDFVYAAKKATREKPSGIELELMIPKRKRNYHNEDMIRKRLWDHFRKHYHMLLSEKKKIVNQGSLFCLVSIVLMFTASYLKSIMNTPSISMNFAIVLIEPAGWFLFWEGLNSIVFRSKEGMSDLEFYKKMTRCKIHFVEY